MEAINLRGTGAPWCAAFNRYVYDNAGLEHLGPQGSNAAWSPAWVSKPTWKQKSGGTTPKPGDAFGIYFSNLKRVGHTGIIAQWGSVAITIEGNTNDEGNREGDGVYRKRRSIRQIYAVQSYIND